MESSFVLTLLAIIVRNGLAQSYSYSPYHQNAWAAPFRNSYQMTQALPASPGAGFLPGGRILEAVKALPMQYPNTLLGNQNTPSFSSLLSSSLAQSSPSLNPGYYRDNRQLQQSYLSTSIMNTPTPEPYYYPLSSPSVTTSTVNSFGQQSSPQPPSSLPYSSPMSSAPGRSLETYREALNLFSEVVRKLEKETGGNGYPPQYKFKPSLLTNAINGYAGGFPPLDDIMGPDFLQRAHKLYNKIIAEQRYKSVPTTPPNYQLFPSISGSKNYLSNGLSYLTSFMKPSRESSRNDALYSYNSPSPYSRNMATDRVATDSALQRSLIDTVQLLESNIRKQITAEQSKVDDMSMSESRFVPHFQFSFQKSTPIPFLASPSPDPNDSHDKITPDSILPQSTTMQSLPPKPIPLSQNDFIEHPLPYHEYEQLIRDIALNH